MKLSVFAAIGTLGVMLSGCASIIQGSSQSIAITTPPTTGADCILSSKEGNWSVVTPGAVTVEKSKEDIVARCTKVGFQDASATIPSDFQGWTVGNLVFGGLIGVGVDAATGAINQYPKAFQIPMFPVNNGQPSGSPTASIQPQYVPATTPAPLPAEASNGSEYQSFDQWQNSKGKSQATHP